MTSLDLGVNVPIKHIQRRQPANSELSSNNHPTKKHPDKLIINCLHCGKIFDFRGKPRDKVLHTCDFCYNAFGTTPSLLPPDVASLALKDRLVEYDKESAKRTTVYDDQSDYFEIDANAWLDDEEREALKARAAVEAELKEERKRQIRVTFDLMGRAVIMDKGGEDGEGGEGKNDGNGREDLLNRVSVGGGNYSKKEEGCGNISNSRQSSGKMIPSTVLGGHDTTFTYKKKNNDEVVLEKGGENMGIIMMKKKKKKKKKGDGNNSSNGVEGLGVISRVQYEEED
jgi:hypothetical protein